MPSTRTSPVSDGYQIPRLTGLIVPQGNRWTLDVQMAQGLGNNYKGDLELEAVGLPQGRHHDRAALRQGRQPHAGAIHRRDRCRAAGRAHRIALEAGRSHRAHRQRIAPGLRAHQSAGRIAVALRLSGQVRARRYGAGALPHRTRTARRPPDAERRTAAQSQSDAARRFQGPDRNSAGLAAARCAKEAVVTIPADKDEATFRIQANDKAAARHVQDRDERIHHRRRRLQRSGPHPRLVRLRRPQSFRAVSQHRPAKQARWSEASRRC